MFQVTRLHTLFQNNTAALLQQHLFEPTPLCAAFENSAAEAKTCAENTQGEGGKIGATHRESRFPAHFFLTTRIFWGTRGAETPRFSRHEAERTVNTARGNLTSTASSSESLRESYKHGELFGIRPSVVRHFQSRTEGKQHNGGLRNTNKILTAKQLAWK